jgi:hypothetical protein
MVAELSPSLSDAAPGLARRAKLGNRFHYWRGRSGERYLFSAVPFETLADFRSAVAMLAEPTGDGRFLAWTVADIDSAGRLRAADGAWPRSMPRGTIAFVHFLAGTADERQDLIDDLFEPAPAPALSLAA